MKRSEVKWLSCVRLCYPMDCSLPGSSIHGIFQAIVLEWVAIYFSRGSSSPRDRTRVSWIADRCFNIWATREVWLGYRKELMKWCHVLESLCLPTSESHLLIILRTLLLFKSIIYVWLFVTPLIAARISLLQYPSLYPRVWYPPCPLLSPGMRSNSCPLSWWCNPTISSSVMPFSSCPQSFWGSGFFPMNQFFASGGQNIGTSASASIFLMNIQDWFPLGLTGLISLLSKEPQESSLSPQLKASILWCSAFFMVWPITTWPMGKP